VIGRKKWALPQQVCKQLGVERVTRPSPLANMCKTTPCCNMAQFFLGVTPNLRRGDDLVNDQPNDVSRQV
jgi:hypothetical protein